MSLSVHSIMAGPPFPLLLPLCKGLGGYLLLVFWWGWMAFTSLFIVYPPIIGIEGPVLIHRVPYPPILGIEGPVLIHSIPFYYRDCVGPNSLSTEMEFLNGIFHFWPSSSRVISSSLFRLEFLSGFLPSFFCSSKSCSWIDSSFLVWRIFL
jgi:hypothetical protein